MISAALRLLLLVVAASSAWTGGARAEERLQQTEVMRGSFVQQRYLAGLQAPLVSKGTFAFSPAHGLLWRVDQPVGVTTVLSPGSAIQRSDGQDPVALPATAMPIIEQMQTMTLRALERDLGPLKALFDVDETRAEDHWTTVLTPRPALQEGMPWVRSITITGATRFEDVDIEKTNGERDHLTFTDLRVDRQGISPDEQMLFDLNGK